MKNPVAVLFWLLAFSAAPAFAQNPYPPHWWKPVPRSQAPAWEILPQDAGPGEVILSKRNELGLLSNFAATAFFLDGACSASVEGFWQMMKYPEGTSDPRWSWIPVWPLSRQGVAALVGFEAKRAGEFANELMRKNGADWVTYRGRKIFPRGRDQRFFEDLIRRALLAKLQENPAVTDVLRKTGNLKLRPDHQVPWYLPKAWKYHILWMEIRDELQKGRRLAPPPFSCKSTLRSRASEPLRDPRG